MSRPCSLRSATIRWAAPGPSPTSCSWRATRARPEPRMRTSSGSRWPTADPSEEWLASVGGMRAVVVYESMYGNTHLVADAVADGLRSVGEVDAEAMGVAHASPDALARADLIVVGGPTHAHGMTRASTRKAAAEAAAEADRGLDLEPDAEGEGLREWFDAVTGLPPRAAAFDTRADAPAAFTGRASKGIAKRLRHHGCEMLDEPHSFLVTKDNHLEDHEVDEARSWGRRLGVAATGGQDDGPVPPEMQAAARQQTEYATDETDEG